MGRRVRVITEADLERRPWLLDEADALEQLLFVQHGVLSTAQALDHFTPATIEHRLRQGDWRSLHRGVHLIGAGTPTDSQRQWAALLAAGDDARLAGRTALQALGMKNFPCSVVHVSIPAPRRKRRLEGVLVHRTEILPADHLAPNRPPCTTADRAVVDAAAWAHSEREAGTVIAMAFQQRLVTLDGIQRVLATLRRTKRRAYVLRTAPLAAGGAHSLGELRVVELLRQHRLPLPTLQKERVDADGRHRYLDLYWERWRLHVEIDGAHHYDARHAWADADRQNKLWTQGERVLRFPAWMVLERPDEVVAQIRAALLAAGWHPSY